jgi:hypothetical protein
MADALAQVVATEREDYSTSCDNLLKAYTDLSNNLTSIMTVKTTAENSSAQLAAISITLETIITKLCATGGSGSGSRATSAAACNSLQTQLTALKRGLTSGSTVSGITSPIDAAISSRDNLIGLLKRLKCCAPGETYPWCDEAQKEKIQQEEEVIKKQASMIAERM